MAANNIIQPLYPGCVYHIFGKTAGDELAFRMEYNYNFFLNRFQEHVGPVAECLAFSLLPDEYHFCLRFRNKEELPDKPVHGHEQIGLLLSRTLGKFILSYTNAYNKVYNRRGALFMKPFRRERIYHTEDVSFVIRKIHLLCETKNVSATPESYRFSSYMHLKQNIPCIVDQTETLSYFASLQGFMTFHSSKDSELNFAA